MFYEGNDMGCCGSCGGQDADKSEEQVNDENQASAQDQESDKAQEQVAEKD
ncbi:MAG: hypothetical protein RQ936_11115 [Gammaproteobacteria bacterium]|nr:hypothetical protein [Gammaproteobacteria bacterium]